MDQPGAKIKNFKFLLNRLIDRNQLIDVASVNIVAADTD